ncbi:PAS domain S-box-containing protein [Pelagirhabdus alkalitolerans]|uniref:PAS domain S-box-containing protein n=1 Tax=Pelagirhabdus alkalitolerans TaxID=1612202 RepID=A0A1G6IYS0_9BACI|nr:PAS domain-containing protein [Pelagirhabdus alkalitolerans]SDC10916.1 PAS domain S-box-containing protein [Pelagirhabdus alkalitolerans]
MLNDQNLHLFKHALNHTNVGLIITDPDLDDHPIIYVNHGFEKMTGYQSEEIIGQNCRFLQGEHTDPSVIKAIRDAVDNQTSITVQVYNYTKQGHGFWNELTIDPMWIEENNQDKLYFIGVQKDVTDLKEKERLLKNALDEMEQLSTPIVPINDQISVLPLIGSITQTRLEQLTQSISTYLSRSKDDYLILDLSGLFEVDTYVAASLIKLHDLTNLIGTQLVLTGIRPELAIKTMDIGDHLKNLNTFLTVQEAIKALKG